MATNTVGIDKEVEVNRKENLRDHRLYWIGASDAGRNPVIFGIGTVACHAGYCHRNCSR